MSAPLARLRLGRSRHPTVAIEPSESRLQILTAELPEARAIERSDRDDRNRRDHDPAPIDRDRVSIALTFDILDDDPTDE